MWERDKGLFPFTKDVLEELKGRWGIGLISRSSKDIPKRLSEIEKSGIKNYFDSIVVQGKKTREEFKKALIELKIKPEEALVVGDRVSREIKIGNEFGCTTVWIRLGDRNSDSPNEETGKPDFIIDSIEEIPKLLKRIAKTCASRMSCSSGR